MTPKEAFDALHGKELVPVVEGNVDYVTELVERCLENDLAAMLGGSEATHMRGQLLIHEDDAERVVGLLQSTWADMVAAEGTAEGVTLGAAGEVGEDEELPCPACGTAAPLVEGACSDCGIVLE